MNLRDLAKLAREIKSAPGGFDSAKRADVYVDWFHAVIELLSRPTCGGEAGEPGFIPHNFNTPPPWPTTTSANCKLCTGCPDCSVWGNE